MLSDKVTFDRMVGIGVIQCWKNQRSKIKTWAFPSMAAADFEEIIQAYPWTFARYNIIIWMKTPKQQNPVCTTIHSNTGGYGTLLGVEDMNLPRK